MLHVDNLSVSLGDFKLSDLSMTVEEGEYIVVLGMSGVGKTVLLELLSGLLKCDQGSIKLHGKDITHSKIQSRPIRLVYQDQALFPHLSVRKNLEYGLRCQHTPVSSMNRTLDALSTQLKIDHLLDRAPATLSGGEAQRVALGRALATEPRLLLLDEPLSALDPQSRATIQMLLRNLHRGGQTIIHVTHDYEEAVSLATRIVLMENGTIVQTGTPNEIFRSPKTKFVARFVGIRNFVAGELISASDNLNETAHFIKNGIQIAIMTESGSGPGYLMLRSEDITLSNKPDETSALNVFKGVITDFIQTSAGVEVVIDIGFDLSAIITQKSIQRLSLDIGKAIFISFKATAGRFIGES
ncbi:MAG: ABC transporter ATP-binding protein [Deltaproteobacteria bacterium]|jgi:molybdate/tungstate transport system ATP-binding protein|nr:ABC transporter ATP-binding protein [Deltaproteobacteria bacterium]MBT4640131.1 ABC transporter ATP-binding protein [Deltaproteobacteria bacterium]MBT7710963.1 ABC transporter ATP-binding protein [Deltaproteobacteria bacterium]MBT7889751.1 ABC transporter ATP-binding protein [Deltaproteobacteria bacterium]